MAIRRLLVSNDCVHCETAKEVLKDEIKKGMIFVVNIDKSKDAKEMARTFGGVPTLIEESNGEIIELFLTDKPNQHKIMR